MSITIVACPRQRSHSRVRVPWDLRPYFTVSDLRLPFLSPPTTRRVVVFDPASTRDSVELTNEHFYNFGRTDEKALPRTICCFSPVVSGMSLLIFVAVETCDNPRQLF
jgi:hypothetical protein